MTLFSHASFGDLIKQVVQTGDYPVVCCFIRRLLLLARIGPLSTSLSTGDIFWAHLGTGETISSRPFHL